MRWGLSSCLLALAASADPIADGYAWLRSQQDARGAFGSALGENETVATFEAAAAFAANGQTTSEEVEAAKLFLGLLPSAADREVQQRRSLALVDTAFSFEAPRDIGAASGFEGYDVWSAAWALLAGKQDATAQTQAFVLSGRALPSGCYGVADNDASVELTALVARALRPFVANPPVAGARAFALACLATLQQPGGGFGTVEATASAALAFAGAGSGFATPLAAARGFVLASQRPDGSFGGLRASALALQSLGAAPDWKMHVELGAATFVVAPHRVPVGQTTTAHVLVANASGSAAPAAPLRITALPLAGGAPILLGDFTVPPLAPGQEVDVQAVLSTAALSGRYQLRAEVDPLRLLPELDRSNNVATSTLNVVVSYDLAVDGSSLTFGSGSVSVRVRSLGSPLPITVPVDVWKGGIGTGVKLGTVLAPAGLGSNQTFTGTVSFSNGGVSGFTAIWAAVDPNNQLDEFDEDNNAALRFYENGAEAPVNLRALSPDFSVVGQPLAGRPITLHGLVRNISTNDANRVVTAVKDASGATLTAFELPAVAALSSVPVDFTFTLQKSQTLQVVVDPDLLLNDTNRNDNTASVVVTLSLTGPNLTIESITGNVNAQNGTPETLTAQVRNEGSTQLGALLRVTESGHELSAFRIQLDKGELRNVVFGPFVTPNRASTFRICIDPFNETDETNENDNCADFSASQLTSALSVSNRDMAFSPVGAEVGEVVHASSLVRNASAQPSEADLEWWRGVPGAPTAKLLATQHVVVPPNGSAPATFDFVRDDGVPEIHVKLSAFAPRTTTSTISRTAGRHLFLEDIVDLAVPGDPTSITGKNIRVGRLDADDVPELVVTFAQEALGSLGIEVLGRQSDGHYARRWMQIWPHRQPGDVALVDLDGDGQGEIVMVNFNHLVPDETEVWAFKGDGTVLWNQTFVSGASGGTLGLTELGLGDVNSDGRVDVLVGDSAVRAFSGPTGAPLLAVPFTTVNSSDTARVTVLDVDSSGTRDIFVSHTGDFADPLLRLTSTGTRVWGGPRPSNLSNVALVDLDLDGSPDGVDIGSGGLRAFTLRNPPTFFSSVGIFNYVESDVVAGALRQDGLPYVLHSVANTDRFVARRADLASLWDVPTLPIDVNNTTDWAQQTLADLLGKGRPQVIVNSCTLPFFMLDGRTGESLVRIPDRDQAASTCATGSTDSHYPSVVADLTGTTKSHVVVAHSGTTNTFSASGSPYYQHAEALIFHSTHWKKMPPTWPTRRLIHGRIDDSLHFTGGDASYRWWTTHNTYNQQFETEPARLLADLTVAVPKQGPATANQVFTLTATLRNEGGLTAAAVPVSFYDGEQLLGTSVVPGPLAIRTGTAPVTFAWNAWPEGQHTLCVVANEPDTIEESGRENNRACTTVLVRPATAACDLEVVASSLSAAPQPANAGDLLTLTATVQNIGALPCTASRVTWADGPDSNPGLATQASLAVLAPGASTTVSAVTVALPDTQTFTVVADPDDVTRDGRRENNVATLTTHAEQTSTPDLVVLSVAASPQPAFPGELLTLTATVTNRGALSPPSTVSFTVGGTTVIAGLPEIQPDEVVNVTASLGAPAVSGAGLAQVDPQGTLSELTEANNALGFPVDVQAVALTLSVVASPATAGPDTAIGLAVALNNSAAQARELQLTVELVAGTTTVQSISGPTRVLAAPGASGFNTSWNTARTSPGAYAVRVRAFESGRYLAETSTPVTVLAEAATSAVVAVDRGTYAPRDTVVMLGRAINASRNQALIGATVTTTFFDSNGVALQSSMRPLPALPPLAVFELSDAHVLSPMAVGGTWRIELLVQDALNAPLASASATYLVDVTATRNVISQTVVAPLFPVGPPLPVHVELTNDSSVPLTNAVLSLELFDISGPALFAAQSISTAVANVGAGATAPFELSLVTAGIGTGPKLLLTRLDGRILERLRIEAIPFVDNEPPIITIAGVTDGQLGRLDVTPLVSVLDASAFTASSTLDGLPFVSGTTVSFEGLHVLAVTATDIYGNTAFRQVRFTIDKTAPVLTLVGVSNGSFRNTPVTLAFSATDSSPVTVASTVDGVPFSSGDTVSTEGPHVWVVTATDAAGNVASQQRAFVLDFTAPVISITGVANGELRNTAATISYGATDANPVTVSAVLDATGFASGGTVSSEGTHTLVVTAIDAAGNSATATRSFELDFTAPVIGVAGVTEAGLYRTPRTITFSSSDAHPGTTTATLNGAPFASGTVVAAQGTFTLVVTATDAAGNVATLAVHFEIDVAAPVISIAGVVDGQLGRLPVTITYSATDAHPVTVSATVDGAPFASGGTVSSEGSHTLVVTATDAAGNSATETRGFILDLTPPVITIVGVAEAQVYAAARTITFSATDAHPGGLSATLNGAAFASGATVSAQGSYTLLVTATDAAGNSASRTVHFDIDTAAPAVTVTGVVEGQFSRTSLVVGYSVSDAHAVNVVATLDGAPFVSGGTVSSVGAHTLNVSATDVAGNASGRVVHFTLDFSLPIISLNGVSEGQTAASFIPVFTATDASPVTVTATLDGAPFASGTTVSSAGAHTLVVTATDAAGNVAQSIVHFTVSGPSGPADPPFQFSACGVQSVSVSNSAQCTGSLASGGSMTLQNAALVLGDVVATGNLSLSNSARVTGRGRYGGTLSISNSATVQGGAVRVTPAPSPCSCSYDVVHELAVAAANNDNALIAGSLTAGGIDLQNTTLTLPGGTYFLTYVRLRNNARLNVAAGQTARLFVSGNVQAQNPSVLGCAPPQSGTLIVVSGANSASGGIVEVENSADATLRLYAPRATVRLRNSSRLTGAVVGKTLSLESSHRLVFDGTSDGGIPMVCP